MLPASKKRELAEACKACLDVASTFMGAALQLKTCLNNSVDSLDDVKDFMVQFSSFVLLVPNCTDALDLYTTAVSKAMDGLDSTLAELTKHYGG